MKYDYEIVKNSRKIYSIIHSSILVSPSYAYGNAMRNTAGSRPLHARGSHHKIGMLIRLKLWRNLSSNSYNTIKRMPKYSKQPIVVDNLKFENPTWYASHSCFWVGNHVEGSLDSIVACCLYSSLVGNDFISYLIIVPLALFHPRLDQLNWTTLNISYHDLIRLIIRFSLHWSDFQTHW